MRALRKLIFVIVVSSVSVAALGSPASAHEWTGSAAWAGGHTLGVSQTNQGNVVSMWQMFVTLRYTYTRGSSPAPPVTGSFSTTTANYTKFWQGEHNLTPDGIVGPNTWNAARFWHVPADPPEYDGWRLFTYYDSSHAQWVRTISLPYHPFFDTWFVEQCGGTYNRSHITHGTVTMDDWICD